MKPFHSLIITAALLAGAAPLVPVAAHAGSCCGGGSATSLIVPKYARALADLSFDTELYDGYWNQNGTHRADPPGSDLKQYRLNLGYAHRLARDWQAGMTLPYVWNENGYSGLSSSTSGLGDTTLSLWYEALDDESAWKIRDARDLIPAVTMGLSLLLPTGISPYDDVKSSFDVTGRGFYRLDGNLLIDKTVQPWNASIALTYGTHFERSVNREYGRYVSPYRKELGDRFSASVSGGYRFVLGTGGDTLTGTASYTYLHEDSGSINGADDITGGFEKQSAGLALTYANLDRDWSARIAWNHAIAESGWGRNFPTTDIITVGVRYVFR
jgi:hypothetical protein